MPPSPPSIATLPTELLLEICTFLTSDSIACLSFSSRLLYTKLPPPIYNRVDTLDDILGRITLLQTLERDRPSLLKYCEFCKSLHDRVALAIEDIDQDDYFLAVHEPVPPSGDSRRLVFNVKRSHVSGAILRASRIPGTEYNEGACIERFSCKGKVLLTFSEDDDDAEVDLFGIIDDVALKTVSETEEDVLTPKDNERDQDTTGFSAAVHYTAEMPHITSPSGFSATVYYTVDRPHITPRRRRRNNATFTHLTTHKLILSTAIAPSYPHFTNLRTVLSTLGLRCCSHCPGGAVEEEVVCKLFQMLEPRVDEQLSGKKCACMSRMGKICKQHRHQGGCKCGTDVEVKVLGGFGVEVRVWRYGKGLLTVGRAGLRKNYMKVRD